MTETATPVVEPDAVHTPAPVEQYEDYWSVQEPVKYVFPDGKQWFLIQPMNEGKKATFQKKTNRDIVLNRSNDDAKIAVDPAGDRHTLIKESVVDWNLMQKGPDGSWSPAPFSARTLDDWLTKAPPHIVEKVEHAVRMANPWLQAEMTVEAIDEEIERLYELRKQAVAREEGEAASANK